MGARSTTESVSFLAKGEGGNIYMYLISGWHPLYRLSIRAYADRHVTSIQYGS